MSDAPTHARLDHMLDRQITQRFVKLMDQELWLMGRDILAQDGNLLITYDCTIFRDGLHGRRYVHNSDIDKVYIWAFGMGIRSNDVCVFVPRYVLNPAIVSDSFFESVSCATDPVLDTLTPGYSSIHEKTLLVEGVCRIARWISRYERWVSELYGTHRTTSLQSRKRAIGSVSDLSMLWEVLAHDIETTALDHTHTISTDIQPHNKTNPR